MDATLLIVPATIGLSIYGWYRYKAKRLAERRAVLIVKYGSATDADRILRREVWVGMTSDQLIDSLGPPVEKDSEVKARKITEIWKYGQTGVNRFTNRVTVNNGLVSKWTQKA